MPLYNIRNFYQFLEQRLRPLGDPEYQQRIWIRHEDPQIVDDYDDATMYFLEDCKEIFNVNYEGMDDLMQNNLKELYDRIDQFDLEVASNTPKDRDDLIISHPEWIQIQKQAHEAYHFITNRLKEKNYENPNTF